LNWLKKNLTLIDLRTTWLLLYAGVMNFQLLKPRIRFGFMLMKLNSRWVI
jgi:hypothetical protein